MQVEHIRNKRWKEYNQISLEWGKTTYEKTKLGSIM